MPFPFMCPVRTVVDPETEKLNSILLPLRDDQKLGLLWSFRSLLTEPIRNPCGMVFHSARGGLLALNISRSLSTGAKWTVTDQIANVSKWPDDTVM